MISESEIYAKQDRELKEAVEARISLETYINSVRKTVSEDNFRNTMGDEVCTCLTDLLNDTQNWLDDNDKCTKDEYNDRRKELEDEALPQIETYMSKMNKLKGKNKVEHSNDSDEVEGVEEVEDNKQKNKKKDKKEKQKKLETKNIRKKNNFSSSEDDE